MSTVGRSQGEGARPSEEEEHHYDTTHSRRRDDSRRHDDSHRHEDHVDRDTAEVITGGSTIEVIAGAGAVTLGVLGLAGVFPVWFVTISIIAVGAGLMFAGGSIAAKYRDVLSSTGDRRSSTNLAETGGGISAETIGGAAGVALGVLALVNVLPTVLAPVALIVLGGALAFGAGATRRLCNVAIENSGAARHKQRVASESVKGAAAIQVIAGLGAAALGVLTLVGIGADPLMLSLIAILALGGGLLISGLALGGEMIASLYSDDDDHHRHQQNQYDGRYDDGQQDGEYRHRPGRSPA